MFEVISQYDIPYWHPVLVHFPIALLSTATLFVLIWTLNDKDHWLHVFVGCQILGAAGAILAFQTGEALEDDTEGVPIVDELVHDHELFGKITLVLALATTTVLLAMLYRRRKSLSKTVKMPVKLALLILSIATALFLVLTAHLGGTMVWGIPSS